MKIPAPMIPPITAMVVPKRPRCRASAPLCGGGPPEISVWVTSLGSIRSRELVEKFDVRAYGAIYAMHFGVFRFDEVVLVRRMCAAAMTETEVIRGQMQRVASENVARP